MLAAEFINAGEFKRRGVLEPMKDFFMQRLALSWRDESQEITAARPIELSEYTLAARIGKEAEKQAGEVMRAMTIDRQRDHFWCVIRAWCGDGSSRLLWRGKLLTVEQAEELRALHGVEKQLCFEDAQYDTAQVYADCVRFGWTALHGDGCDGFTHILRDKRKVRRFYSSIKQTQVPGGMARYMFWASDPVKDMLAAFIRGDSHPWGLPADVGAQYLSQIGVPQPQGDGTFKQTGGDAKRERVNKSTGRPEWRWVKVGANHLWDCEAMQVAVALALRVLRSADAPLTKQDGGEEQQ